METKIGHQIQKLRKGRNMSQEKLAEKLGVSRHSTSNWEREVSNPDLKTILETTKLFNVSLNRLTKGAEIMQVNEYVYSALAFFLGGFEAHKSYVKKNKNALLYLLFRWTGIPGVIGMVEGASTLMRPSGSENSIEINQTKNKKPMYRVFFSVHVNTKSDGVISHKHIRFRRDYKAIRRSRF